MAGGGAGESVCVTAGGVELDVGIAVGIAAVHAVKKTKVIAIRNGKMNLENIISLSICGGLDARSRREREWILSNST